MCSSRPCSHWRTLPCFRFLGRNDGVDLVGEKISATLAQTVLDRLDYAGRLPITLLALDDSSGGRPGYVLLLESSAEQSLPALQSLAQQLENALLDNFHYRLARDLELVLIDAARGLGNRRLDDWLLRL